MCFLPACPPRRWWSGLPEHEGDKMTQRRLIEEAFPLQKVSEGSRLRVLFPAP